MLRFQIHIPAGAYEALWAHLLPQDHTDETVAFMYTHLNVVDGISAFQFIEWSPIKTAGFVYRSPYHLELTDKARGSVIKRAHDLGSSLVEFHSHIGSWPARFSPSDHMGFEEFVPHVWWRLKGRPYVAIVVSEGSFDGLVWHSDPRIPEHLESLIVSGKVLQPTRLSLPPPGSFDDE